MSYVWTLVEGHGGKDPGAIGPSGLHEADVVLKITQFTGKYLGDAGVMIVYTRAGDKFVSLNERANFANDSNCDCFVSIHCNASKNPQAYGIEVWYYPGSGVGRKLTEGILDKLKLETGLANRGLKESAGLAVLRLTAMPAVLVELPFISNPKEEMLLKDAGFQRRAARAIAEGIAEHLGLSLPASSLPDPVVEAIEILQDVGVIGSPDYWLQNARPGKTISGENATALIQKFAKKIKE